MPSNVLSKEKKDSLILQRIYEFKDSHPTTPDSIEDNVYVKFRHNVERRNLSMWLIPTLHVMAKDNREFIRESYNRIQYQDKGEMTVSRQLLSSTIRHNRKTLTPMQDLISPNIYDVVIYDGHMLSPFNKKNRRYYRYNQELQEDGTTRLNFWPRIYNTQLVKGYAIVNTESGHIIRTVLDGEYDMISFRTEIRQSDESWPLPTPKRCISAATFRFAGNRISTLLSASYNNDYTLPDSIDNLDDRALMDSIRPIPLSETDKRIYEKYDQKHAKANKEPDTVAVHENLLKKIFWDTIGENLVTPLDAESEQASIRLSPIINPLYLRYSGSRGFSYKIRLRAQYNFSAHRYLRLNPTFGYNFKIKQFYFTAPLRMTYNPKRNGYAEIIYGNGNRISNSSVADFINHEHQDTLHFDNKNVNKFNDNYLTIFNNIMLLDWLDLEGGFIFHQRKAIDKDFMRQYQMPIEYRSFAPMIGLKITPWRNGPLFSIDWERGLRGTLKMQKDYVDIDYERWEFDASWKCTLPGLRILNLRAGGGLYSRKKQNYFVDYSNFRDNNLPEGWNDEWSGDFQILRSSAYNSSDYYVRANASYESPMMVATWVPYLGKYIEKERFYLSGVLLDHSKPFFELSYSFTNRYISIGAFAGFKNLRFQEVGFDFEFELFRRW